ncbi:UDP-glucose 4-epimerase GalE [Nocardioides aurantiacus]|uniref:UDP-glucose 4-epimerase n=1 Tax=Nocardioides aurantiacus TaxID=86796 RepID=A0A3N2CYS1_9ACTN|nr:UDP-glucose 4-epimerase GalE [Nocardioides aurantiacus]ROR92682.1 UDP-galactose 4-epimerase [Nocardioides aurantiacus]
MKVLVTGGAGYIGSTTATALEAAGHEPVVLDSLLTGPRVFVGSRPFYEGDVADRGLVARVFADHPDIGAVIHMAARVVVAESVDDPYGYYRDNVVKSLELVDQLAALGCTRVVLSSSASVYAAPATGFEVTEDSALDPQSPYARTKLVMELALADLTAATPLRGMSLRYFNPIGADPALATGLHVRDPSHVLGQLLLASDGRRDAFAVSGTDYPTPDGTGVRDYVHVWDLARAHVAAVERFDDALAEEDTTHLVLNVGTGSGVSVRELVAAFERVHGRPVPVRDAARRPGDSAGAYANVDRARRLLRWRAEASLEEAIGSALAWWARREQVLGYP